MSWVKEKKKAIDLSQYDDIDEDLIVEGLTEDELRELNAAIDPEVCIDPSYVSFWTSKYSSRNALLAKICLMAKRAKERYVIKISHVCSPTKEQIYKLKFYLLNDSQNMHILSFYEDSIESSSFEEF